MVLARNPLGLAAIAIGVALCAGAAVVLGGPLALLLAAAALAVPLLTLRTPEAVTLIAIAALFLNAPGIAVNVHHLPAIVGAAPFALLLVPLAVRLLLAHERLVVDVPLLLIVAFLGAVLLSFTRVEDSAAAVDWLVSFLVEGLLTYFVVLNLFRTRRSLERAVDVMMLCGALLGTLNVYQQLTGSYTQQFGGLAQRNVEYLAAPDDPSDDSDLRRNPDKIHLRDRAGGPLGQPDRYGQMMLCLAPLVLWRMRSRRGLVAKLLCLACIALIVAGVFLSYSRGAFVGLVMVIGLAAVMRFLPWRAVGLMAAAAALVVALWAPGYLVRLGTLAGIGNATTEQRDTGADPVIRGRLTEMMAAFKVFLDHPLIGVGPGQYMPIYSLDYMSGPDALRRITVQRRAHTLYFELAAETGVVGLGLFLTVVGLIQVRLWRAWRRWRRQRPDLAQLAAAAFLSVCAYLLTAIFLQLAYQRYYWLFLGFAGAALQILAREQRGALQRNPVRMQAPRTAAARELAVETGAS